MDWVSAALSAESLTNESDSPFNHDGHNKTPRNQSDTTLINQCEESRWRRDQN